jgi:SulP family sulfate permease
MAETTQVEGETPLVTHDVADEVGGARTAYDPKTTANKDVVIYRVRGALFFGATTAVSNVLDRIGPTPKVFVLDLSEVPVVDSTAGNALRRFAEKLHGGGAAVYLAGASKNIRRALLSAGLRKPLVRYASSVDQAMVHAGELLGTKPPQTAFHGDRPS